MTALEVIGVVVTSPTVQLSAAMAGAYAGVLWKQRQDERESRERRERDEALTLARCDGVGGHGAGAGAGAGQRCGCRSRTATMRTLRAEPVRAWADGVVIGLGFRSRVIAVTEPPVKWWHGSNESVGCESVGCEAAGCE